MQPGDATLARALMRSLAFSKSTTDFLQFLVTTVLSPLETKSAAILQLSGYKLRVLGEFGLSNEEFCELNNLAARDPFLMSVVRSSPITYREAEEFVQDSPIWLSSSSTIPGPCVILPFETLETIQGVVWVRFESGISDEPLTEVEQELVRFAGELIVARSQSLMFAKDSGDRISRLTEKERKVLDLAKEGLANKQIARELLISESWAKKILQSALSKSGLASRSDLFSSSESL